MEEVKNENDVKGSHGSRKSIMGMLGFFQDRLAVEEKMKQGIEKVLNEEDVK